MFFILVVTVVLCIVYYGRKKRERQIDYFRQKGIPFNEPKSVISFIKSLLTGSIITILETLYSSKPTDKFFGFYDRSQPAYFLRDPELIKKLAIKEFDYFIDHRAALNRDHDTMFGNMLLMLTGNEWRNMRSALSPAFTGNKMRLMFQLVSECAQQFTRFFQDDCVKNSNKPYDMKDIHSRFTNDVIASCAFGVQSDSLRDPQNTFYLMGKKFMDFQSLNALFKFVLIFYMPFVAKYFNVTFFNSECKKLFTEMIINNMRIREKENIVRPDMIQLLMELKKGKLTKTSEDVKGKESIASAEEFNLKSGELKRPWSDDELVAQCFIFFLAGFDSSSSLMALTAYELAVNPDVQAKLLDEIDSITNDLDGGKFTYDHLEGMKYLDMVLAESLRKWPPGVMTDRLCVKDYLYKDDKGTEFTIDKGSVLWIPIYALHRDEKHFPEPEKFDPERFSDENKASFHFEAYMPFGVGPRNCIGSRFALMEAKVLLYHLLSKFSFAVCEETQIPLKMKRSFTGFVPYNINIVLEPRN